jgi:hypothetical protein
MERVAKLPEKPDGYLEAALEAAASPGQAAGLKVLDMVEHWRDWGFGWPVALGQFCEDAEFNWLDHRPPVADW